jgi:glycosyltransferase involved in cell wall biosynthesis
MISESIVTIGIKSFLRPDAIERTLKAIEKHNFAEVIVADDSPIDQRKKKVFERAGKKINNFRFIKLPEDVGLSAGRNEIVKCCRTQYLLMLDDDQEIPENIMKLAEILDYDKNLGGVSCFWREFGEIKCTATNLIDKGRYLIKDLEISKYHKTNHGTRFTYADFIPNSTLFRINCLRDISWDSRFKIGSEHVDFFLAHKRLRKWKFAVTSDVIIEHFPKKEGEYSASFRHNKTRLSKSDKIFKLKWGKTYIINGKQMLSIGRVKQRNIIHALIKRKAPLFFVKIVDQMLRVLKI